MVDFSRRQMLAGAGLMSAGAMLPSVGFARGKTMPPGIQLWTVKEDMAKDPEGTLKSLGRMGFKRVEAAGWHDRTPAQFRKMVTDAGLDCVSCHYGLGDLIKDADTRLAFARDVGVKYVVASSPAPTKPLDSKKPWPVAVAEAMSLEDWRSNAEAMNMIGAKAKALGLRFGYHNHSAEFLNYNGVVPLDELARNTDPANVVLELDIGWVAGAGYDPVDVIKRHASRIHLLHIKDLMTSERVPGQMVKDDRSTVIGKGTINWPAVFRAARKAPIYSYFYEQEDPFTEPALQAASKSLAYLKSLHV
ncbi:MAG: sugar phosphate isomerase/epimerase family protein [Sphingomicrobium sp.]